MTTLATAWMLGCVCGFFMGVTVAGRRKSTCRELMRPAATPKPGIIPKPQFPPPRKIREDFLP